VGAEEAARRWLGVATAVPAIDGHELGARSFL
jgi:hypothetical protein